jgi:hypothetical protein
LSRVGDAPLRLVAVDVASDLRCPGTERTDELGQLNDLARLGVEGEAPCGERLPELGIGGRGGMPDAVDGVQRVPHPDCVQPPPASFGDHPGVNLQVQVTVRISGPGGVMPHRHHLDFLHRDLHLGTARADPGGRVLGQPGDDLPRGPVLRRVIRPRDVGVQFGRERP